MTCVNEPGLYSLVLGSRKPEAKAFKRWVTHDVIPAIRKTGTYSLPARPQAPKPQLKGTLASLERTVRLTRQMILDAGGTKQEASLTGLRLMAQYGIPVPDFARQDPPRLPNRLEQPQQFDTNETETE